jgi:hypothetical protein
MKSSNGNRSVLDLDADLFRFRFGVQSIHILHKEDYSRLPLSNSWHYKLKRNGRGTQPYINTRNIVTSTRMSVAKWFTENVGFVMFMGTCGMLSKLYTRNNNCVKTLSTKLIQFE